MSTRCYKLNDPTLNCRMTSKRVKSVWSAVFYAPRMRTVG